MITERRRRERRRTPHSRPGLCEDAADVFLIAADLVGRTLEPAQAIEAILRLLAERLGLDKGRVVLPDEESGTLRIHYSHGLSAEEQARGTYALGEGVTGRVMAEGGTALLPDTSKDADYLARISGRRERSEKIAFIAVPIIQDQKPIGVLAVNPTQRSAAAFDTGLYVLQVLAAMIALALRIDSMVRERTDALLSENRALKQARDLDGAGYGVLGRSKTLLQAQHQALRAASSEATVMLVGESGTGKEKFARMIHVAGSRRDQPFVCINCAAIPENLLESELFGHEKGSFTGATSSRPGKFELATGGTLFLDEIGDMNIDLQAKLLRTLQEKRIQRIGGRSEIPIDVRIITATHKNLQNLVNNGRFRHDLYYRLNVIRIGLPALRERKGDIRLLATYFVNRENQRYGRNIILPEATLRLLEQYDWPGNIRQLENIIERAVIMTERDLVTVANIEQILGEEAAIELTDNGNTEDGDSVAVIGRPYARVDNRERRNIINALKRSRGNKTQAAQLLGLTARQLHYRLKKLEIGH